MHGGNFCRDEKVISSGVPAGNGVGCNSAFDRRECNQCSINALKYPLLLIARVR